MVVSEAESRGEFIREIEFDRETDPTLAIGGDVLSGDFLRGKLDKGLVDSGVEFESFRRGFIASVSALPILKGVVTDTSFGGGRRSAGRGFDFSRSDEAPISLSMVLESTERSDFDPIELSYT